ncbi:NAD+ synthase [Ampullimonas aquatilis]|uniref:NAD+ synthase n=1 Tax=Ampullimonas aquatilis TaxID=1341549 RepID=UPI003C749B79
MASFTPAQTTHTSPSSLRVAIGQINSTIGDFAGNRQKIMHAAGQAAQQDADILVTPELSLAGYPPEDLLLRPAFYAQTEQALQQLATDLMAYPDLYVVVGFPARVASKNVAGHPLEATHGVQCGASPDLFCHFNAAAVLHGGAMVATYYKQALPNYDVFDEQRYFQPGTQPCVFSVKGVHIGLNICEDIWYTKAPAAARAAGAQILLVPNGSPFHTDKQIQRYEVSRQRVQETGMSIVYANLVGGQDELVFDGASFVMNAQGKVTTQLVQFEETVDCVDFVANAPLPGSHRALASVEAQVYQALVLGVRDYLGKNGFPGAIIGLSGGVDSALVLAVAVDALGADKVRAVMMPSPYTADISWIDARDMANRLGVRYDEIPIVDVFSAFRATLAPEFDTLTDVNPNDTTEENIQARIRGTLLMALSNKYGSIVLTTGNKSEMAVGYCTLYGDMAGGFAVIKDIAKTLVYRVCHYRNSVSEVIPERILTRAPSAELRPNQTDQDSLPPYEVLDAIMQMYMEQDRPRAEIIAAGYSEADVDRVTRLIKINEYKRRQAPIGIRVTERAFGRDWRYPIVSKFRE